MGFQVSPGIDINEVDQTNVIPATSTSIGAYAGHFNWGPSDTVVTVGSEKDLTTIFGSPTQGSTTRSFLTAASFLKYSNTLRVSRAIGAGAINAANASPTLIKNKSHFDTLTGLNSIFSARYPGKVGNSIQVSYAHVSTDTNSQYNAWTYKDLFDSAPNRSLTAVTNNIESNDEIHLVVIDRLGLITGTRGSILEKYEGVSLGSNAKNEDGASIFYKDVINQNSSYIYVNTLSGTFDEADVAITPDTSFQVTPSSTESIASIELPFILSVETTVTYSGGASVTTVNDSAQTVIVKAGYLGEIGNNVKLNIRYINGDDTVATSARGYIRYNAPGNGDTVTVDDIVFTKASTNVTLNTFATIENLAALIDGLPDVTAVVIGSNIINIASVATGVGTNDITLSGNTGTLYTSGPTLRGGFDAASMEYVAVEVDLLSAATGYVTYDVTVSADQDLSGDNFTDVTLGSIIDRIDYVRNITNNSDLEALTFEVNGTEVTSVSPIASMRLNIESILPYSVSQTLLSIKQFTGGEVITYDDIALINTYDLTGGADGSITPGDVTIALGLFADKELVDINLLFAEIFESNQEDIDVELYNIANSRKDIVAFISAPIEISQLTSNEDRKLASINKFAQGGYTSSSYIFFDETPVYTYNKYADKYVWIPACGHMAGLCANTDFVADPWFSPAGFNRGQLKGVTKIAYNPGQTDRDDLYKKRINSIISIPGQGIVLYGDKTALSKPSAFDHINVRRLFNVLERSISNAAKFQLFEFNDEFTRASFKNMINPFLRDIQGRRGIIDFRVICDETNNTPEIIDTNQFIGDIYIKPARSINFIKLNFIATRTGVDFRELTGQ